MDTKKRPDADEEDRFTYRQGDIEILDADGNRKDDSKPRSRVDAVLDKVRRLPK